MKSHFSISLQGRPGKRLESTRWLRLKALRLATFGKLTLIASNETAPTSRSTNMCIPLRCPSALPTALLLVVLLVGAGSVHAHGVLLEQNIRSDLEVVEITAVFDNGEPMAGALITVFNPRHLTHPWLTGRANGEGRFWFVPDAGQPGYWTVRVREEGHGAMISIEVPDIKN